MENSISGLVTKRNPNEPPRKPIQRNTRSIAGYNKPVRLYDPRFPNVILVPEDEPEPEPEVEPVAVERRVRSVEDPTIVAEGGRA